MLLPVKRSPQGIHRHRRFLAFWGTARGKATQQLLLTTTRLIVLWRAIPFQSRRALNISVRVLLGLRV